MSKNKIEKIGWIGKGENIKDVIYIYKVWDMWDILIAATKKGALDYWPHKEDWPPKKVKITIEEL